MVPKETWAAAAIAAGAAGVLAARAFTRVEVSGTSMVPTLLPGDRLLVCRPRAARGRVGNIVVLPDPRDPERSLVKRVVAVEGAAVRLAGDNPAASTDSRVFGSVPVAALTGCVLYRYAPADRVGRIGGHR